MYLQLLLHFWTAEYIIYGSIVADIALNDRDLQVLEEIMKGLSYVRDAGLLFDICFEPLAHVVREGVTIGIVYEPSNGRMVDYKDRAMASKAPRQSTVALLTQCTC